MSAGFYDDLAKVWQESKIDGLGYLNPQEGAEDLMKQDSRAVESLAKKWNIQPLEREAHENAANPALGIARASVATGAGFAGAGAANAMSGAAGASSGLPAGLEGTMESALIDTGYTPSTFYNALKYGPDSGQSMGTTMQNYGQGLMDRATSPGFRQGLAKRYAMNQGMSMMSPQQNAAPPPPPPPRPVQQQQPSITPYGMGNLTEEQKMQLRMMGYRV